MWPAPAVSETGLAGTAISAGFDVLPNVSGPCPLWVKSRHRNASAQCPLYPHVWTAPSWQGESSRCRFGRCTHVFGLFARFTRNTGSAHERSSLLDHHAIKKFNLPAGGLRSPAQVYILHKRSPLGALCAKPPAPMVLMLIGGPPAGCARNSHRQRPSR